MKLTKNKEDTVIFPLSVFNTADTIEDLEDWLLSKNPEFIRRMRKARQEDLQGKGKSWRLPYSLLGLCRNKTYKDL